MAIFNSLGSNYSWRDVWRHLFAGRQKGAAAKLSKILSEHFGGKVILTYKGREALEIALKQSGLAAGSLVGINGFTCYAVYRAIENAGLKTVPIDTEPGKLNFGLVELRSVHAKHPDLKVIIVQNTLGYPPDMAALQVYCKEAKILIIEDLAHSTGLVYGSGREAGMVGDITMMSFSQDKPLDVVAGGAMIDHRGYVPEELKLPTVGSMQRLKNRLYPFWTAIIRGTYPIGLGRFVHFGLKKLNLMATPMSDDLEGLHTMTDTTAALILERWQDRDSELAHRRQLADIYGQQIPAGLQSFHQAYGSPTYLRFPIWVEHRDSLITFLRSQHIYIGDTWYDAPIGPKKYLVLTDYQTGMCPNAEELAEHIVNLPTHRNVTPEVAADICAKIKQWQALPQKP